MIRRKKDETLAEFLKRSDEREKVRSLRALGVYTEPEPKYRMERVTEVIDHPVFGRIERPVYYRDKNGRLRVKMRRVK